MAGISLFGAGSAFSSISVNYSTVVDGIVYSAWPISKQSHSRSAQSAKKPILKTKVWILTLWLLLSNRVTISAPIRALNGGREGTSYAITRLPRIFLSPGLARMGASIPWLAYRRIDSCPRSLFRRSYCGRYSIDDFST